MAPGFSEIVSQGLVLVAVLLHCAIVGFAMLLRLGLWRSAPGNIDNPYLRWFFALSCGLAADIALLFVLGISGWLERRAVVGCGLTLLAASVAVLLLSPRPRESVAATRSRTGAIVESLAVLALFLVLVLQAVRAPGHWDDTAYHLPLARSYVESHAIVVNEYLRFPLFPQNMNLLFALGLMLGGEVLAQALATVPLFILSIGLIGAGSRLLGSPIAGFLAVLVMMSIAPVRGTLGYAYVDNGLALFCWGATLALALWIDGGYRSRGWLVVAGLLAGVAAGTKFFGAPLALLLGLYLVAVRRDWRAGLTFGMAALAFGSWWYVRSAIVSGDPVHPAGGNVFGHFLWNAQDLIGQKQEQATHGAGTDLLDAWKALAKAGVRVWALAFLSLAYFRTAPAPIRLLQGVFLLYFAFWFFVAQLDRYLAPVVAAGSLLSVFFVLRIGLARLLAASARRIAWPDSPSVAGALSLAVLVPMLVVSFRAAGHRVAHWDESLRARAGFTLFQHANALIPSLGPTLVQIGFENGIFFFRGVVIGDWFGPGRYRTMMECRESCKLVPEIAVLMEGFGARMLAVNRKRFRFDADTYRDRFELLAQTDDGLLLRPK